MWGRPCSPAFGGLRAIFGVPCFCCITLIFVFSLTWCYPCVYTCFPIPRFYKLNKGPPPTPEWLHLNDLHLQQPCFQVRSCCEVAGATTSTMILGRHSSAHNRDLYLFTVCSSGRELSGGQSCHSPCPHCRIRCTEDSAWRKGSRKSPWLDSSDGCTMLWMH